MAHTDYVISCGLSACNLKCTGTACGTGHEAERLEVKTPSVIQRRRQARRLQSNRSPGGHSCCCTLLFAWEVTEKAEKKWSQREPQALDLFSPPHSWRCGAAHSVKWVSVLDCEFWRVIMIRPSFSLMRILDHPASTSDQSHQSFCHWLLRNDGSLEN